MYCRHCTGVPPIWLIEPLDFRQSYDPMAQHAYSSLRIGVCQMVFSRPYFSQGWAISKSFYPSICPPICHECTVATRCKIGPRLLLITSRKSHKGFEMTNKLMTLDNHEGSLRTMEWNGMFQAISGHISKMCKTGPRLLLITNRKWHTPCLIRWKSLALDDLEGRYAPLWLNGARQGLSCYWSQTGSRILAFKLPANHRPWMTLKVSVCYCGQMVQNRPKVAIDHW